MTTPRQATTTNRRRPSNNALNFDLVDGTHWNEPHYVRAAVRSGHFITCSQQGCRRILGVGKDEPTATADAGEVGTQTPEGKWLCPAHKGE